jgi:hypothetical protein
MHRITALALAAGMSLAAPLAAETAPRQSAQLAANAQFVLNRLGFQVVDAGSLSTRQLAAIQTQFNNPRLSFGRNWINSRGRMKVILGWDGFETR